MKQYTITGPAGIETTVQLSDEEAKARGLKPDAPVESKAKKPANKAAAPANKAVSTADAKRAEAASQSFGAKQG